MGPSSSIAAMENMKRKRANKFHILLKRQMFNLLKNLIQSKMLIKAILVVTTIRKAVL